MFEPLQSGKLAGWKCPFCGYSRLYQKKSGIIICESCKGIIRRSQLESPIGTLYIAREMGEEYGEQKVYFYIREKEFEDKLRKDLEEILGKQAQVINGFRAERGLNDLEKIAERLKEKGYEVGYDDKTLEIYRKGRA